ncbi:helix-turn-helix domain-containing protein [Eubacterium sp. 1001713B170207_170306_E7]|uniref:helix-turn-helix domain-containing protein n=1 Tax=Eubacterium sp. 1001713B170207_170306_E7 TaxID=2787097 RepID=UPI001899AE89|nr:helix-turn-helix domain-containing protein [Eubacterium sp. 1001713B170207_170306_E7]
MINSMSGFTIITPKEAAQELRISIRKMYEIIKTDPEFPAVPNGRKWLIIKDEIPEWLEKKLIARSNALVSDQKTMLK